MKILMFCHGDWGGSAYAMMKAINETTDHEARLISTTDSYIKYPRDIFRPNLKEVLEFIQWSDLINIHDDADMMLAMDHDWRPVLQTFRGTWYRTRPEHINKRAKQLGYLTACMSPDLMRFGATWTPKVMPNLSSMWNPAEEFTVIHAPTRREMRGTDAIIAACEGLEGVTLDLIEKVTNEECLRRKAKGHLLIDQTTHGKGPSAGTGFCGNVLEAWSMGMPAISYATPEITEIFQHAYGEIPFCQAKEDLRAGIIKFRDDPEFYAKWVKKGQKCLNAFHAPEVAAKRFIELCEKTIVEATPPKPAKISVCMIVRDEEECIKKAITSCDGLCDEIVIADTGSKDKTIEIAESLGAKVITEGDRWHKGEARNTAIREADGDWIVILDADETIIDPKNLKKHINHTYADALMVRLTQVKKGQEHLSYHQQRVWRKGTFWYKYRAHELPKPDGKGFWIEQTPFVWLHEQPEGRGEWKGDYALKRLEMDLKENPDDPRPIFYLARQYRYISTQTGCDDQEKYEEDARTMLHKYLDLTEATNAWDRPNGCYDLSLIYERRKDIKGRIKALYLACESQPMNRRWWAELARAYAESGNIELATGLMETALKIPKNKEDGYSIPDMHQAYPYDLLAQWHGTMGRYQKGYEYCKEALAWRPDSKRLADNIVQFRKALAMPVPPPVKVVNRLHSIQEDSPAI